MLVELAIGDAYGARFEFAPRNFVQKHNNLSGYVHHPRHSLLPGNYTDDTQMSIALTEAILSEEPWNRQTIAKYFVRAFERDPRQGYAAGFYGFLKKINDADEFLEKIRPHSDKSGGAMRASPIGVYPEPEQVVEKCKIQAEITHDTPDGTNAAIASSLTTHYFLYNHGRKANLDEFLESHITGNWSVPWKEQVSVKGMACVRAAVTALVRSESLSDLLQRCIAFTGDVDTVAAITMPAGACAVEMENDLPSILYENLENGAYGRDYIAQLDEKFLCMKEHFTKG